MGRQLPISPTPPTLVPDVMRPVVPAPEEAHLGETQSRFLHPDVPAPARAGLAAHLRPGVPVPVGADLDARPSSPRPPVGRANGSPVIKGTPHRRPRASGDETRDPSSLRACEADSSVRESNSSTLPAPPGPWA